MDKEVLENLSLEEAFNEIENLMAEMSDDISLEQAFEKYKDGMDLLKFCGDKIDRVEKQIQILNEAGSQPQ